MNEDDDELLARCRLGDQAAWTALVARHARRVFGLGYRMLGNAADAEDLVQEVFVKVVQSLDRYDGTQGAFGAWLGTVARHQVIDRYRRGARERAGELTDALVAQLTSPETDPETRAAHHERVRLLRSGLAALPVDLREPLVLCDLHGVPYDEIAATLDLPLGTVKSRINRGRLELARRLQARVATR